MVNQHLQFDASLANTLARSYSPLLYFRKLRELLESLFHEIDFSNYEKYDLHKMVNNILANNYYGEEIVKYQIAKKYLKKNTVGAFEIKARNSRADFLSINGVTRCYEIKTKLDNLNKLIKQSNDYGSVFEYNTIILDKKHLNQALRVLPIEFGITLIEEKGLRVLRHAKKHKFLCSKSQLEMLTSKELTCHFGLDYNSLKLVLDNFSCQEINRLFKKALKNRYFDKWYFVKEHNKNILPIDFQFFFSTKESPSLLYQKDFKLYLE
ncbi:MAG: sce7726 family protein [Bacteroidota bacterium]